MNTKKINYDRSKVTSGILHFGVGNFHRAHLQAYTNALLSNHSADGSQAMWGICGAMLLAQDKALYERLESQSGRYSLTICGRDGSSEVEWIGSLVELLWIDGEGGSEAIINKVADAKTKIISLTITEGGYNLNTDGVQADIANPNAPRTVFGIVAEGLRRRRAAGHGPLTILSCDNLQHNGDICKGVFERFFMAQDSDLASWASANITYPNSMVDRITPATTPSDVERLNKSLDEHDRAPVYCEDYLQWVVEENFAAGRPAWESVGVEFTADVVPYENMKLSLLNASHTLLSYPSLLSGYRKVDEAMGDPTIRAFVEQFMNTDVTPYVPAPANTDLELYKRTLVERFANSSVSDQVQRLCGDGASKFPVYVMPIAAQMISGGEDMVRIAYLVAAYRHYLKHKRDDHGTPYEIFEPQLSAADHRIIEGDDAVAFLSTSAFTSAQSDGVSPLAQHAPFVELYTTMVERLEHDGAMKTLQSILS